MIIFQNLLIVSDSSHHFQSLFQICSSITFHNIIGTIIKIIIFQVSVTPFKLSSQKENCVTRYSSMTSSGFLLNFIWICPSGQFNLINHGFCREFSDKPFQGSSEGLHKQDVTTFHRYVFHFQYILEYIFWNKSWNIYDISFE